MRINLFRFRSPRITKIETEVRKIRLAVDELSAEMKRFSGILDETQKVNEQLFPDHYDESPGENKTVFVKDGKEKSYETIDWRSR